jgi:hypothetical protein
MEEPHETQRPLAGIGEFFAPQEGQLMDEGVFAAAAIGDRLGKRPLQGKGVTEIRAGDTAVAPSCAAAIRVRLEKTRRCRNQRRAPLS